MKNKVNEFLRNLSSGSSIELNENFFENFDFMIKMNKSKQLTIEKKNINDGMHPAFQPILYNIKQKKILFLFSAFFIQKQFFRCPDAEDMKANSLVVVYTITDIE